MRARIRRHHGLQAAMVRFHARLPVIPFRQQKTRPQRRIVILGRGQIQVKTYARGTDTLVLGDGHDIHILGCTAGIIFVIFFVGTAIDTRILGPTEYGFEAEQ